MRRFPVDHHPAWPMKPDKKISIINDFVAFVDPVASTYKLWKNSDERELAEIGGYIAKRDDAKRRYVTQFLADELQWNKFGLKPYWLPIF